MQSDDVRRMLAAAAAKPSSPLVTEVLLRRGARLRRARMAALAAGLAVAVAGSWASFGILRGDESDAGLPPAGSIGDPCDRFRRAQVVALFLRDDITDVEAESLRNELARTDAVDSFTYVSEDDAYEQFRKLYSDRPDLYETVPPGALPASFRVDVSDGYSVEDVALHFTGVPGIDEVRYPEEAAPDGLCPGSGHDAGAYPVVTTADGAVEIELRSISCGRDGFSIGEAEALPTGHWCSLSIQVSNEADETVELHAASQTLTGSLRNVYLPWDRVMPLVESADELFSGGVGPGESRSGRLVYQLPAGEAPERVELVLAPGNRRVILNVATGACAFVVYERPEFDCDYGEAPPP